MTSPLTEKDAATACVAAWNSLDRADFIPLLAGNAGSASRHDFLYNH